MVQRPPGREGDQRGPCGVTRSTHLKPDRSYPYRRRVYGFSATRIVLVGLYVGLRRRTRKDRSRRGRAKQGYPRNLAEALPRRRKSASKRIAAVDHQRLRRDHAVVGAQEDDRAGDILRGAVAAQQRALDR